ncbi:MAG: M50 family metallopeptidase [Patescibacteria group bacterium]|jgi:hypothetical protein
MMLSYATGGFYRIFVAPGIILHELSHAFFCLLTGAKVVSINFFKSDGGEVKHGHSKIPIIGPILISLSPFVIGALAIYFLSKFIGFKTLNVSEVTFNAQSIFHWFIDSMKSLNFTSISTIVAFYLILSIAVTMTPSVVDMRNILVSILVILFVVFIIFRYTHFRPSLGFLATPELISILVTVLALLILAFILSIFIFAIKNMFSA